MNSSQDSAPTWKSKLGFILASSGAAVGLGNVQRFPYITSQNGGAAFLLLYLGCVLLVGLPLILVEFATGRAAKKNPVDAMIKLGKGKRWGLIGALGALTAFLILSYYIVAAGWTVGYAVMSFTGSYKTIQEFASMPGYVLGCTFGIQLVATLVVSRGLNRGIETFSKFAMPTLFLLLIILVIRSVTLDNAAEGVKYYLLPDFSKLTSYSFIAALCQAFFSLCIGEAVLIAYGSYTDRSENLPLSSLYIVLCDTLVAFLAGLIIFPALFSFGQQPETQGAILIYNVMPRIFENMPMGYYIGGAFFIMLGFAALTTCVALLEVPAYCLSQYFNWDKRRIIWILSFIAFLLSIPAALSQGSSTFLTELTLWKFPVKGYFELMDYIWGGLAMVVTGLLTTLFCGHKWGTKNAVAELSRGCSWFEKCGHVWSWHIRFSAPLLIMVILASLLFI